MKSYVSVNEKVFLGYDLRQFWHVVVEYLYAIIDKLYHWVPPPYQLATSTSTRNCRQGSTSTLMSVTGDHRILANKAVINGNLFTCDVVCSSSSRSFLDTCTEYSDLILSLRFQLAGCPGSVHFCEYWSCQQRISFILVVNQFGNPNVGHVMYGYIYLKVITGSQLVPIMGWKKAILTIPLQWRIQDFPVE